MEVVTVKGVRTEMVVLLLQLMTLMGGHEISDSGRGDVGEGGEVAGMVGGMAVTVMVVEMMRSVVGMLVTVMRLMVVVGMVTTVMVAGMVVEMMRLVVGGGGGW